MSRYAFSGRFELRVMAYVALSASHTAACRYLFPSASASRSSTRRLLMSPCTTVSPLVSDGEIWSPNCGLMVFPDFGTMISSAVTALPSRISRGTQSSTVINVRPSADASGKSRTSISRIRKTVCLQ